MINMHSGIVYDHKRAFNLLKDKIEHMCDFASGTRNDVLAELANFADEEAEKIRLYEENVICKE